MSFRGLSDCELFAIPADYKNDNPTPLSKLLLSPLSSLGIFILTRRHVNL